MNKPVLYSSNMEFEHQKWKEEIAFWEKELKSFNSRLSELITRWTKKEKRAQIGHYQKQFIFHGGVIEDLLETMEQQETRISEQIEPGVLISDVHLSKNHIDMRNRMETQREIYAELKKNIFRFLEK